MSLRPLAIGRLCTLALVSAVMLASSSPAHAGPKPGKPQPTATPSAVSSTTVAPIIGVAASLEVVRSIATGAALRAKQGKKVRAATLALVVDTLQTAIPQCDQASIAAKKDKAFSALCTSLATDLALAEQARDKSSTDELAKLSATFTKRAAHARKLAIAAHPSAQVMISAVALRLALANAIASVPSTKGTTGLIGEKGMNGLIGEKGMNGLIGEKGMSGLIGEKGMNAVTDGKRTNAIDGDMLIVVKILLDAIANDATSVAKAKPFAKQLAEVRDGIASVSSKGGSAWAVKRALQAADWANEALIAEMHKP